MKNINPSDILVAGPGDDTSGLISKIFNFYLTPTADAEALEQLLSTLNVDVVTGAVTPINTIINFPDQLQSAQVANPNAVIVCVMPDIDDDETIANMTYHKHFKTWIQANLSEAVAQWPELDGNTADPVLCEQAFMSDLSTKVSPTHWRSLTDLDLIIDFKTVIGQDSQDLNQIIADFLETPKATEIDTYISQYRAANQQYIIYR
jgi:hypothetical protein